jgi:hypothetical protein
MVEQTNANSRMNGRSTSVLANAYAFDEYKPAARSLLNTALASNNGTCAAELRQQTNEKRTARKCGWETE